MLEKIGISGHIQNYDVFITGQGVVVLDENGFVTKQAVSGLLAFAEKAHDLRLGWATFDDFEVIYIYDKGDHNAGYGVNLHDPMLSEWGSAPFQCTECN
jgi:hypothetical protein